MTNLKQKLYSLREQSLFFSIFFHIVLFVSKSSYRQSNPLVCPSNQWHLAVSLRASRAIPKIISRHIDSYFFKRNIFFLINNIPHSVGHCYGEIDYSCRYILENPNAKLVFIYPNYSILANASRLVRYDIAKKMYFLFSGVLCVLFYPIIFSLDKSLLDLSLGQQDLSKNLIISYGNFWHVKYRKHVEMINRTGPSTLKLPFNKKTETAKNSLFSDLGIRNKYVVIQIKDSAVNATFSPIQLVSLIPAIEWLISQGYDVVQGGRENTPDCFKKLGVKTYGSINIANSFNDAILYSGCSMAISSGSGVNNIPSKFGKPQLITNVWNFGYVAEKTNLVWPTRLIRSNTQELISLKEQFKVIRNWDPSNLNNIYEEFEALDATADEIMCSLNELDKFRKTGEWAKSDLRDKFHLEFKEEVFSVQKSKIADHFIEKYYMSGTG